jgi:hypothetical protein
MRETRALGKRPLIQSKQGPGGPQLRDRDHRYCDVAVLIIDAYGINLDDLQHDYDVANVMTGHNWRFTLKARLGPVRVGRGFFTKSEYSLSASDG